MPPVNGGGLGEDPRGAMRGGAMVGMRWRRRRTLALARSKAGIGGDCGIGPGALGGWIGGGEEVEGSSEVDDDDDGRW